MALTARHALSALMTHPNLSETGQGSQLYGCLALARVYGGNVTFPNGEQRRFESFSKAEAAWQTWIRENALPEATKVAREGREAFIDACTWDERKVSQPGLLTPALVVREVLDPDGKVIGDPDVESFDEIVMRHALSRFPMPTTNKLSKQLGGGAEKAVVWAAVLYLDNEIRHLPAFSSWSFGLPIDDVLSVLNELAEQGWSVAHVSEDRGIYEGETNGTDSAITRARYLLVRKSLGGVAG